ncbi:putative Membrane-associated tyrosine- and threonine-specific cdc2-inhibitory kinase [Blattamonas nauphoetae]|uniref:Membrane-associated tyrosine- and threonine-specific cdc2-inhibitory kinase n=1 Tax=Blattamonas nauphoetae TaxID=2049346 RepID=A0ABQ9XWZ5_9EUKA|nr:putative Membrane-associated tyrosine- and threonine-specific cdc2-inhibitory kinase [Blattamonas nauphoetae]
MSKVVRRPKATKRFEVKVPDPYKFIKTLGQGRFGSVHQVSKTPSDEHFAMKILTFSSESDFEKNKHEISKLEKNQHRNVVGFVEAIEGDHAHFVVLELCSHSLQDEMSENKKLGGKMDVLRVYRVMRDVLDGIASLHSHGEIFGDLKPSNVLIGKDGTAKLGDFGGVMGTGTMKTSNSAENGTIQFWAPEFFKKAARADTQIGSTAGDMWAFGLLLLEILTSRSWIVGNSAAEIEKSQSNPSQRISSAELLRTNRLQSVLGPETPLSRFFAEQLESTRQQLENERSKRTEEPETLIVEKADHENTRNLLKQEQQARKKDQDRIAQLETDLAKAKEELQKSKELKPERSDSRNSEETTLSALPRLYMVAPRAFNMNGTTITRTDDLKDGSGIATLNTVLFEEVLTKDIVSASITLQSLPQQGNTPGIVCFGLMESSSTIYSIGAGLGMTIDNSVAVSHFGILFQKGSPSSSISNHPLESSVGEGGRIRIEINMDSTPRTARFFLNGNPLSKYVSGIPESVRIGVSLHLQGTSIRVDSFTRLSQPTPTTRAAEELKW